MSKVSRKAANKPKKQSTKKYEKPLSLHPMSFPEALDRLLQAKPKKRKKVRKSK